MSSNRPNFSPTALKSETCLKPSCRCSCREGVFSAVMQAMSTRQHCVFRQVWMSVVRRFRPMPWCRLSGDT